MRVHYQRVSSLLQNTERQKVDEKNYDLLLEDKCSGAVPFFERPSGMKIKEMCDKGDLTQISVLQIDRLGRNMLDILNTIHYFSQRKVCVHFLSQGLRTIEEDGTENPISKMMISILGVVSEMEKNLIRERQLEGIKLAKIKGIYKGRRSDTKENPLKFLSKPKNQKVIEYLKKGYKGCEISKIVGVNPNTISKIKRVMGLMVELQPV
jgi:DNA invertase Pin-like site-specific DNA recombinase